MSTAANLLQRLVSEQIENESDVLIVDHELRTINIPSSIKVLGVASDDEVLRLHFRLPRFISITDLSDFSFRINYSNSKNEGDVYTVDDAYVDEEFITFSWLVGPVATRYKGKTKFTINAVKVDSEGYVDKEYNTTTASLDVLEGLETNQEAVTEYSDIVEQWRQSLFEHGSAIDLSGYVKKTEIDAIVKNAIAKAIEDGEFDGKIGSGITGVRIEEVTVF